ncbi:MAG: hypothetical protein E6G47_13035 [Actinobacteria bacterium]|nr:MAG: hypothetical protein E6G47_13035 [Actinomycetota bacterium]
MEKGAEGVRMTMKKRVKWLLAAALIAYIMVPASIILMHDFGAWWGAMVPWFLVALLAGSWWVIDTVARG